MPHDCLFFFVSLLFLCGGGQTLVTLGLWTRLPQGLETMLASPRLVAGRRVLVASCKFRGDTAAGADYLA